MRIRYSLLSLLRDARFSRVVAGLVIAAIVLPVYQPLYAAASPSSGPDAEPYGLDAAPGQALSQSIREAKGVLQNADQALRRGDSISAERKELAALRKVIQSLDAEVRAEFKGIGSWLAERQLPETIVARHEEAFAVYRDEIQALLDDLALIEIESADEGLASTIERVHKRLSQRKHEVGQHPFNPAELPHEAQRPRADNLPRTKREDFLGAGLFDSPLVHLAALDGYRFEGLPGADDPAYLDETVEVRLTAELRAKAAELGHDPVAIYHWVRNHVEWLPTWGAVQDAELTLSARRGNAMDIASLLIALLRVSGIPARYVHGTIEVSEADFRNWAGGFEHIEEAMNYAASGGIPITGLTTGGRVTHVRMEHIWVEAAVDFLPSRGAVMREADTWLPLDASYKQYEFFPGLDTAMVTGIDSSQVLQGFLDSGIFSISEGWVRDLNGSVLLDAQRHAEQALEVYVQQLEVPTIGDVIGGRKAVLRADVVLPSGLPYQRAFDGVRYASMPGVLSPKIVVGFGVDVFGQPLKKVSFAWAELNSRKVTVSFRPASADDEAALAGLIPEGGLSDPSAIPSSIPAYLIEVVPELRVEGQLRLEGVPMPLGQELPFTYSVTDPAHGVRHYPNQIVAGSYLAVGVVGGNVAPGRLEAVEQRLRTTTAMLYGADPSSIGLLTREDILGDTFHAGLLGYFGQYQSLGSIAARTGAAHFQMTTSAGTFGYVPTVTYLFGIPRSIEAGGAVMDLDRVAHIASTDGKGQDARVALNFQLGALASGLEHTVPEQLFARDDAPGEGVSAVRALEKALAAGQRVYHIDVSNQADALRNIRQNALAMAEIRSALAVGREVIVHTDPIAVPGWKGAGYIIFDPQTGAGAWKITGGANGGFLDNYPGDLVSLLLFMGAGLIAISASPVATFLALSLGAIATFNVFMTFLETDLYLKESNCPKALANLHLSLSVVFAALPGVWTKHLGGILISSFYAIAVDKSINSSARVCRVL
jgi:transglutaminase-like putative cysteine protease